MSDEVELLTYKELAARLGVKLPSARQTVSRKRWKRIKGNDTSEIRVAVPVDYLRKYEDVSEGLSVIVSEGATVDYSVDIATLKAENAYLHQRIADLQGDRDSWKELASRPFWKRLLG